MLAGRKEGAARDHVASTLRMRLTRPGAGSCCDLTPPSSTPTTKTLSTGSITISHQVLPVCYHRRNSLYLPVDPITVRCPQECGDLRRHIPNHRHCGDVYERAPRAQPHSIVKRWRRSPAPLTLTIDRWPPSSRDLPMHPPTLAHTKLTSLSQLRHTPSQTYQHSRATPSLSRTTLSTASAAALVRVRHRHLFFT
jgi:hypothetical protein